ncbi:MAG TPA: glycosyltransferase [Chitinophagaceae bacterium]|nr:glycosyltransferase [Chitinophagaceae bacterium]
MDSVLYISLMNSTAWGGSEEIWYKSALHLAGRNQNVGVCCFNWKGKEEKLHQLQNAGCKLYLLPGKSETKSLWGKYKVNEALYSIPFSDYKKAIVNQGGWKDVAHGPFKKLYKKLPPYILIFHNYDTLEKLHGKKKKSLHNWVEKAEKNIGDAGRIFSVIKNTCNLDIPRNHVLFNPVTIQLPGSQTPFTSPAENRLELTVLAELDIKRKAQDVLIQTLSAEKWKNRNFKLNIYGTGKDKQILEKLVTDTGLSSKVFLNGFTKEVKKVLTDSHVLLQLTHIDAMPISVTEGLAMSRAVVASDVGDMPLWINEGVNGWIAGKVCVEEIDRVLENVWQNRGRLEEMGKESYRIFRQKYPGHPVEYFLDLAGISLNETKNE